MLEAEEPITGEPLLTAGAYQRADRLCRRTEATRGG